MPEISRFMRALIEIRLALDKHDLSDADVALHLNHHDMMEVMMEFRQSTPPDLLFLRDGPLDILIEEKFGG
jgi:hypothetical protein